MATYLQSLQSHYRQHANADTAVPMKKYMQDQFEFLGIKSPEAKLLFRQFVADHGLPETSQIEQLVRELWTWPEREFQYVALMFLDKLQKQLTPDGIPLLEHIITHKSWWDTVDSIAIHHVGKLLRQYPDQRDPVISSWRDADDFWLRRTTLLFQLDYKAETDESLLFDLVTANHDSSEFFIRKAIGWALREYSKTAPDAVKTFVQDQSMAPLSRREALKWMKSKGLLP
ncbi:DNA alkylation repair protein [filamentous cyanobacterium CCP5]|nr:DNA alkylation repair protein [filamentous cyanobacterium CCP5]